MTYPSQAVLTTPDSGSTSIHTNATVTTSGNYVLVGVGSKEVTLVVNITATPTGTTPTLQYTLQEVDPGDQTAVFGPTASTSVINAIGVYTTALGSTVGGAVKISWVVTGAGASFTGVYATASTKIGTASNTSGAVVVSDASIGVNNAAAPTSSSQLGGTDGTNLQAVQVFDADSGAGSQYVLGTVLRKSASGGSVEAGTAADPLRIDPTGATTQPVSGSVAVTSVVPGVGATSLGKAEDAAAASGDTGIAILGVYQPETAGVSADTVGDYATLNVDARGRLRVSPGAWVSLDEFESLTGFTAIDADTANLATTTNHVRNTLAITFDKVNGPANNTFGMIQKTIAPFDLRALTTGVTYIQLCVFLPSLTNVVNIVIRLGTNASNYNSWSIPVDPSSPTNVWEVYRTSIGTSNASVGNGWDWTAVTYFAVGVQLTGQNDALAGIVVDSLVLTGGQLNASDITSEVTTTVNSSNINVQKVGGSNTATNTGAASAGTQRVVIATDDVNLSQISSTQTSGTQRTRITSGAADAAVKAASTAAVAADPALVVAVSPNNTVAVSATSLPLPSGASTDATLATRLADATFTGRINTLGQKTSANSTPIVIASDQSAIPVSGTVTSNIGTTNGLALDATLTGGTARAKITDGTSNAAVKAASTAAVAADPALVVAVSPNNTVAVSAASLPLPSGAATEATLATRLADATFTGRINTQGQKTMAASTPVVLASDQSAIPVSGTVTSNIGTTNGLALDATLTGGTAKAIARGGAKGSTTAADLTSTASGANHQLLDVAMYDAAGNQITTFGGGQQYADGSARGTATGTLMMVDDGTNIQSASGDAAGRLNVNPALIADRTATGTLTAAAQTVAISSQGAATVAVQLTGTWTGTIVFEGTLDGTNWVLTTACATGTTASAVSSTSANGAWFVDCAGYSQVRVRASAFTSGTTAVSLEAGPGTPGNGVAKVVGSDGTALRGLKVEADGNIASGRSASGSITSNGAGFTLNTKGMSTVGISVQNTFVGTLVIQGSVDGTVSSTMPIQYLLNVLSPAVTAITSTGMWWVACAGLSQVSVLSTAWTSGQADVALYASPASSGRLIGPRYDGSGTQWTTISSPSAAAIGLTAQVTGYGTLKVSTEGSEVFTEPFDGATVDTTNRWNQTIVGSATITQASGQVTFATGTTASNAGALSSQNTFRPVGLSFQIMGCAIKFDAAAVTNNHRFWGIGTQPGSWTAATPIQDGAGFELDTTGALNAVTYNSGTRNLVANLVRPADGGFHRYALYGRTDLIYWYIDSLESPVVGVNFPVSGQQVLPIRVHSINHTSGPASAPTFIMTGIAMSESSHSGVQISDGQFPWRKATVDANGRLVTGQYSSNPTQTSVAASASSVQLLAANVVRRGATVFNDSSSVMYLKLGTTASTTSFTARLVGNAYYEVPFGYAGRIDAIWAAATGNARITELA